MISRTRAQGQGVAIRTLGSFPGLRASEALGNRMAYFGDYVLYVRAVELGGNNSPIIILFAADYQCISLRLD